MTRTKRIRGKGTHEIFPKTGGGERDQRPEPFSASISHPAASGAASATAAVQGDVCGFHDRGRVPFAVEMANAMAAWAASCPAP